MNAIDKWIKRGLQKAIAEANRQYNDIFSRSTQQMNMSILQVAQGFTQSIEVLAGAIVNKAIQPQFQYRPYSRRICQIKKECMAHAVHPTGYTQINPSYQEQVYRYEYSQPGMDNSKNKQFNFF